MRKSDSGAATVPRKEAAELAAQVAGPVLSPGEDGYTAERNIYNLTRVLEPALSVGVTSDADVQAAVRFAAQRGLPVAVNNTGHQIARTAHGAVLISTKRMNGVTIGAGNQIARIEPGVRFIGMIHMDPPEPLSYWDRTTMLADLPEEALDAFVALTGPDSGCPLATVEIRQLGGAMDREPAVPNAVPTRGLPFVTFAFGVGGPDQEDRLRGYLAKLIRGLEAWSAGRLMPTFLAADEATTPAQLRAAYGEERYDRLARAKKTYDPRNMFRMNHNIVPA